MGTVEFNGHGLKVAIVLKVEARAAPGTNPFVRRSPARSPGGPGTVAGCQLIQKHFDGSISIKAVQIHTT